MIVPTLRIGQAVSDSGTWMGSPREERAERETEGRHQVWTIIHPLMTLFIDSGSL